MSILDIIEGWKYIYGKQQIFRLMGASILFNLGVHDANCHRATLLL
jgi:hypothetical protein